MAITLFYVSFVALVAMLAIKYFGISFGQHEVISNIVCENDKHCHNLVHHSKRIVSKIKFKNFSIFLSKYFLVSKIEFIFASQ